MSRIRLVLGFLAAPLIPALLLGAFASDGDGDGGGLGMIIVATMVLIVAYVQMFVIGLPAWMWAARKARPTLRQAAVVGAAVAAGPWLVLLPANLVLTGQFGPSYWANVSMLVVALAALGALGGAVAWAIAYWRPQRAATT